MAEGDFCAGDRRTLPRAPARLPSLSEALECCVCLDEMQARRASGVVLTCSTAVLKCSGVMAW